ncbi:hypothetical protein Ahy_A08g039994 [Arachis hypogaea]|uniref:Anthocyanidin 3-O-glucosyltransferase n=1 Tax=Arachis hypogaea TaxID=3818 RepID=A0A445BYJ7_ARAHY|nr:hypothetical protein Ahy_A08g039994 [Arachis hypogaea]
MSCGNRVHNCTRALVGVEMQVWVYWGAGVREKEVYVFDHVINARILGRKLKVGVEVEQGEEDGLFSKESVCKAVKIVMDDGNEVGREIRDNHTKVRNLLLAPNFESSCLDDFILRLQDML